jgi:hypothetical protein
MNTNISDLRSQLDTRQRMSRYQYVADTNAGNPQTNCCGVTGNRWLSPASLREKPPGGQNRFRSPIRAAPVKPRVADGSHGHPTSLPSIETAPGRSDRGAIRQRPVDVRGPLPHLIGQSRTQAKFRANQGDNS